MSARTRVIPCLLLNGSSLVKTKRFNEFNYIGDPINTVRIFNELEVDELMFLDIGATRNGQGPNFELLEKIASECFMPLSYGGGLREFKDVQKIFEMGFEKIVLNSINYESLDLVDQVTKVYGSQAVVGSIDYKKNFWGKLLPFSKSAKLKQNISVLDWAIQLEKHGVGEILLTSIDHEGTWQGFDYEMIKTVSNKLTIPVIAHGGAGSLTDIQKVVKDANASAVALGSMVVYQKKDMGVLINFPDKSKLRLLFD